VIELSRYLLEVLRKDEEFILYRGRSQNDPGQAVFASYGAPSDSDQTNVGQESRRSVSPSQVLVLAPEAEYRRPERLKRLEHEYALRQELASAWAARPMAIARHWDRPVLVLEDPGGLPLNQLLGQPMGLTLALRLAIGLSNAIDQLHQRGMIHKDIKPANVLVNSATGHVWLTGFGIASRLPRELQSPDHPEFIAGTLAYMAPEQTGRMNRSTDSRSDLYSYGVTLYEMLTGFLPFTAADAMEWVH
jgi:serine/threonine protein kinase